MTENKPRRIIPLYPEDTALRWTARQNGWLALLVLAPLMFIGGVRWVLDAPSPASFVLAVVVLPAVIALAGLLAIRWGQKAE